jgi:hypothetical protein
LFSKIIFLELERNFSLRNHQKRPDKMQRIQMDKIFYPENYGLLFFPDCKGKGKLHKNPHGFIVCSKCGGSRVVRKKKENF